MSDDEYEKRVYQPLSPAAEHDIEQMEREHLLALAPFMFFAMVVFAVVVWLMLEQQSDCARTACIVGEAELRNGECICTLRAEP